MKPFLFSIILIASLIPFSAHSQIEKVIVETYYVSDASDSTDVTGVQVLEKGSKTYRVYVDLKPGSKITKIYGDVHHALKISSTANFYNNYDRPTAYFGYLINKTWFPDNPLLALDSWITIGRATKTNAGVIKAEDTDGSFIGGANNFGGSEGIAGGLMVNNDAEAGIPVTVADGLMPDATIPGQWSDNGFRDLAGDDTTVFGSLTVGSKFISNDAYLQQNSGVAGANLDSNRVLVAQLTTTGEISFELNLELEQFDGTTTKIVNYVADGTYTTADTLVSPALTYPPSCGCKDPKYLEYNAAYGCDIIDSCKTLIVCGCTDTVACNYNADANFNIPALCCYPGYCNDRDLEVVCPGLTKNREHKIDFNLSPNPATDNVTLLLPKAEIREIKYAVYNSLGMLVMEKDMGFISGTITENVDLSGLKSGLYLFRLQWGSEVATQKMVKK